MTLGNNIKKIRNDANMSQEDFAEMFGVTRQTISNWETSKSYPDLGTLIEISDSFEISLDILLKEDMVMVKMIDHEVRNTKKYARALIVIGIILTLLIGSFAIYSGVYCVTKNKLETNFQTQLEENGFIKNKDGYYSMVYSENVVYGVPNQTMPGLLDFSLDFHVTDLYCYIELEDRKIEIIWHDYDDYSACAISKYDDITIGSTSHFDQNDFKDMGKLGAELGIPENRIENIIEKGTELYNLFYPEK